MIYRLRRHPLALMGILGGALLLGTWGFSGSAAPEAAFEPVAVTRGAIEEAVTAQGKLEPKEFVDVGAQVSGQLLKLHVEIGDTVKKGDTIAEIDPRLYTARVEADEARLKTLRAQLAEQEANIAYTRAVHRRNETLRTQDAISAETLEASEKEYKAATARASALRAQIEEAESTLAGDKANLSYTTIYAPIDGTVVSQSSKEGQTLNANQMAPVIVQLANLDTMTVRAQVAEADVARITPQMAVYFTTLGSPRRWKGTVRQLLPSPDATVLDVILYNALVDVENTDRALMTGMSAQMFFVIGQADNALLIPARALGAPVPKQDTPESAAYEVRVVEGGRTATRVVQIGYMTRTHAEVRHGLAEGETVAVPQLTPSGNDATPRRFGPRI